MSHRHAVALRAFSIATKPEPTEIADGEVLLNMDGGQFATFEICEIVREATPEEVEAERARRSSKAKPKKAAEPKADATA